MRTPEEIGKEVRDYIVGSSTYFLHYHDKEGRTTEGKALFLGGPLDMVVARVEAIVRDERQHQAKLEADKQFLEVEKNLLSKQLAQLQEENERLKSGKPGVLKYYMEESFKLQKENERLKKLMGMEG